MLQLSSRHLSHRLSVRSPGKIPIATTNSDIVGKRGGRNCVASLEIDAGVARLRFGFGLRTKGYGAHPMPMHIYY